MLPLVPGLAQKLKEKDVEGLKTMFGLYLHQNATDMLRDDFKVLVKASRMYSREFDYDDNLCIQKLVTEVVTDREHDDDMITNLLTLKALVDEIVSTAFITSKDTTSPARTALVLAEGGTLDPSVSDRSFVEALSDAFGKGFKTRRIKPAEMLAKYLDSAMRKGQKSASDAEFNTLLDRVLVLYNYTDDKDMFRKSYHRMLAKRLLLARSASDDFEKEVLKKLKTRESSVFNHVWIDTHRHPNQEYDPEFDMGEGMFTDLALSKDLSAEYHMKNRGVDAQLSVTVLQRSFWPFAARKTDIVLPTFVRHDL